jgi:phage FluMu gp28-like protein
VRVQPPELPPLYPKQHAAICDPARTVVIEASTKSGKTAGCLIWLFAQAWNGGAGSYWWIAPTYTVAEQVAFLRMETMLKQADPRQLCWQTNKNDLLIVLANGARLFFKSAERPDNLFGDDVRAAVIDEATRCSEEAWNAVRSTLTATRGPVRIIGNVKGRKNWVFKLARLAEAGTPNMAYHKLTAYDAADGGIIARDEIDDARRVLSDAVFRELYLAEPSDDGSNPFGADAIRSCVADLSNGKPVAFGVDLAKSTDWTVACGIDSDGRVCVLERWQSDWRTTRERLARLIGNTKALIDSTGVGDPIVEDITAVCRKAEGFKFTSQSKQQLMEGLANAIQEGSVRYPDGWLRAELESFGFRYTGGRVVYEASAGHDDGVCALALAVAAKRQYRPFFFKAIT